MSDRDGSVHAAATARVLHAHLHLLDRQVTRLYDRRLVCKVDDLEVVTDDHGVPYVTAILAGSMALGPRIGGALGWLMVATSRLFRPEERPEPYRIGMNRVAEIGSEVLVSGRSEDLPLERWVRENIVARLPWAGDGQVDDQVDDQGDGSAGPERGRHSGAARISGLIGRRVVDTSGALVGETADVRLVQDGPMLGEVQQAFRVAGFVVVPRHSGQLFGYERGPGGRGPWLVGALVRWIHRDSVYVTWDQVDAVDQQVRLRVPRHALAPLNDLYERDPTRR